MARRFELAKGQLGELDEKEPFLDPRLPARRAFLGGTRATTTTQWRGD